MRDLTLRRSFLVLSAFSISHRLQVYFVYCGFRFESTNLLGTVLWEDKDIGLRSGDVVC